MSWQAAELHTRLNRLAAVCALLLLVALPFALFFGDRVIEQGWVQWAQAHHWQGAIHKFTNLAKQPFYYFFLAMLLAGWWWRKRQWVVVSTGYIFAQLGGSLLAVGIVKTLAGRVRPETLDRMGGQADIWLGPSWADAVHSFPSGHSADLFTSAIFVAVLFRPRAVQVTALLCALAVALARVVSAKHYPSDIIGGALFGVGGAWLSLRLWVLPRLVRGEPAQDAVPTQRTGANLQPK